MAPFGRQNRLLSVPPRKPPKVPSFPSSLWSNLSGRKSKLAILARSQSSRVIKASAKVMERHRGSTNYTISEEIAEVTETDQNSSALDALVGRAVVPKSKLDIGAFDIGRALGRGKFGRVYLAKHVATNYICALKVIPKSQVLNETEENLIRRELEVHRNLAHPNILKFHSWFHDDKHIFLILEYAPGGDLYKSLHDQPRGRFKEHIAAKYIAQLAQALSYMHRKNVMHRDLKPENVLLGLHNEVKLADFGYSVHTVSGLRSTICGTLDYLPPEIAIMMEKPGLSHEAYTRAIDRWSLGVLAYELIVGRPPFEMKSQKATQRKIAGFRGGIMFPLHVSERAEDFILALLSLNSEGRLSLEDVLAHPWIAEHIERSVQSRLSGLL